MFDTFNDTATKSSLIIVILSILAIFVSGMFFGIAYYVMDEVETSFQATNCNIPDNVYVDDCQDLWNLSVYPFLALRELLVWMSFFFMFAMVLGMLILGYKAGKNPVLLGLLIIFVIVITYGSIELSNVYRSLLEMTMFRTIMTPFTTYNTIMFNFPWFTFFVSLMSVMLSVVNFQRSKVNNPIEDLDY